MSEVPLDRAIRLTRVTPRVRFRDELLTTNYRRRRAARRLPPEAMSPLSRRDAVAAAALLHLLRSPESPPVSRPRGRARARARRWMARALLLSPAVAIVASDALRRGSWLAHMRGARRPRVPRVARDDVRVLGGPRLRRRRGARGRGAWSARAVLVVARDPRRRRAALYVRSLPGVPEPSGGPRRHVDDAERRAAALDGSRHVRARDRSRRRSSRRSCRGSITRLAPARGEGRRLVARPGARRRARHGVLRSGARRERGRDARRPLLRRDGTARARPLGAQRDRRASPPRSADADPGAGASRRTPKRPRDVLLVLTESVRASSTCVAYTPDCPFTPFSNAAAPNRLPLGQMRAVDSTTAISLAVLWSGLAPTESRAALHSAPLLWEYAHAAGSTPPTGPRKISSSATRASGSAACRSRSR